MLVSGRYDVTIAAAANDLVTIRHVRFQGLNDGTNGIQINSAGSALIENCVIENLAQNFINDTPTSRGTKLAVKNTILSNKWTGRCSVCGERDELWYAEKFSGDGWRIWNCCGGQ